MFRSKGHKLLFTFILSFFVQHFFSQQFILSGKITGNGESLPFATIYLKGTTKGVNSNDEGSYSLKLDPGKHIIVFQYVGYSKQEKEIDLKENKTLNINLKSDGIALEEIVVKAGEDPAYPIMRKAIKKRKQFSNEVNEYSCQSYIKGLQRLTNIPEKFKKLVKMMSGEKIDSTLYGVIYLSESESNYYFKKPNKQKEIMFSSRVSGESKSFSFNQLSQIKFNFYENLVPIRGLSDRPLVSPLNKNAFIYYKFRLLGTIIEDGKTFNKIAVIPKRKTDPCFSGIIYIQENSWRLTGIDLKLNKENKIKFVDTLSIKQLFAPVAGDSIWMPVNHNFSFTFNFLGISGDGYFNAIVKNYNLVPKLADNFFSNEVFVVEDGANKKDSNYWNINRPVLLTSEENKDYRKKDSSEKIQDTDRYKDSMDRRTNRLRPVNIFLGYTYCKTKNRISVVTPGLITAGIQYNTVEGVNISYDFSINKEYENLKAHRVNGRVRYGFSNYLWGGEVGYNYFYNPKKFSRVGVKFKSITEQYNQMDPISPLVNSLYSLYLNENYMKMFKETGVETNYFTELTNGVYFSSIARYVERDPLKNTSDRLIIDDRSKLFTSNDPRNGSTHDSLFNTNNSLTAEITFSFRFKQKYYTLPNQKIVTGSKYPRLSVSYKKAFPVLNTTADYDLASAMIYDEVNLGLLGRLGFRLKGGGFVNTKKLYFMDFKYFLGNQTLFNTNDYLSSFRLLPYYTFSADKWFAEAHAEHHFNGFIINKIPVLKKLKVQEVVGGHLLMSNKLKQYYEINFGIENIFNVLRFDYVLGYGIDNRVNSGFTIGINTRL
ncbi:MAG: carboxypeptidase-like regulatory domain-containing protein [Bacteroidetes bacterium]|nr:carboxypeptidase-like regulatory domain-containing protein [Bacteroidota bacterium]